MGDRSGHDPSRPARWAQTVGERARGAERDLLRAVDRLPMEGTAQGSAAEEHGARLSRALELGRDLGAHPSRPVRGRGRAGREEEGREASPTVAIIDSQTAKGAQKGGLGLILRATTRARRSRVASGTSWSTRWVSC